MTTDEITLRRRGRRWFAGTAVALMLIVLVPSWVREQNIEGTTTHQVIGFGQPLPVIVLHQIRAFPGGQLQFREWRTGLAGVWPAAATDLLLLLAGLALAWWLLRRGGRRLWLRAVSILLVFLVSMPVLMVALAALGIRPVSAWHQVRQARREVWIDRAVADVARWSADSAWIAAQRQQALPQGSTQPDGDAILDHFILMRNGDRIAFCQEAGKADPTIDDVFVGKGSDGKWYYSEFHFCVHMITARMIAPFASLPDFITQVDTAGFGPGQMHLSERPPTGAAHRVALRTRRGD